MYFNISFADGLQYTLYPTDVKLLENTGLHELLMKENIYIPRYGATFPAFMHFIYGYRLTISYISRIRSRTPIDEFLEMMLVDNKTYKIDGIHSVIIQLIYKVAPHLLDKDSMIDAFNHERESIKKLHRTTINQIKKLESQIEELLDENTESLEIFEWMPLEQLQKIYNNLLNKLDYYKFRDNVKGRLPYMFIGLIEMLSQITEKKLSENYEKNIKTRLRNDEGIILELYTHMRKNKITHTTQTILSVLTNLFIG